MVGLSVEGGGGTALAFVGVLRLVGEMRGIVGARGPAGLARFAFDTRRRTSTTVRRGYGMGVSGRLALPGLLELDGALLVDWARKTEPAMPLIWDVVLDDVEAGGMAPARARVAADEGKLSSYAKPQIQ